MIMMIMIVVLVQTIVQTVVQIVHHLRVQMNRVRKGKD